METSRTDAPDRTQWRTSSRLGRLALAFVLLTLAALLLVPVLTQRRAAPLRADIDEAVDPARTLVAQLQFSLAQQLSAVQGFLITGDTLFLERYGRAAAGEQAVYAQLDPLANRLGPVVTGSLVEVRTLSEFWHSRVTEAELVRRRRIGPGSIARFPTEQRFYEQALEAASGLDRAIVDAAQRRRTRIQALERSTLQLMAFLVVLAAIAALTVGWLGRRIETLAREADIRRTEAEEALEQSRQATEARDRLIRGVTHDVKNPLGAADGYAALLEMQVEAPLAPRQAEMVAGIRRLIGGALALVNDLLDLSRAHAGTLPLRRSPTDLVEVVRDAVRDYEGAARTTGHRFGLHLPGTQVAVHTDAARVRQILGNLLSNAVKYTPAEGEITVKVRAGSDDAGMAAVPWAEVSVSDSGPGIPPEEQENIFNEFHRLHADEVKGHGLGLAISRRIARLLGGDMAVTDGTGTGATFVLRLPRPQAQPTQGGPTGQPHAAETRGVP